MQPLSAHLLFFKTITIVNFLKSARAVNITLMIIITMCLPRRPLQHSSLTKAVSHDLLVKVSFEGNSGRMHLKSFIRTFKDQRGEYINPSHFLTEYWRWNAAKRGHRRRFFPAVSQTYIYTHTQHDTIEQNSCSCAEVFIYLWSLSQIITWICLPWALHRSLTDKVHHCILPQKCLKCVFQQHQALRRSQNSFLDWQA